MAAGSPETPEKPLLTVVDPLAVHVDDKLLALSFLTWLRNESSAVFYGYFGIGPFSFLRRSRMKKIHAALCVSLWQLAVESAYPGKGAQIAREAAHLLGCEKDDVFCSSCAQIQKALPASGEEDFSPISGALCSIAGAVPNSMLERALALHSRRIYNTFLKMI